MKSNELSRTTVWIVIAAFLVSAAPHMAAMPPWVLALILVAAAWRAFLAGARLVQVHWALRALLTFGGLGLVVVQHGTFFGRRAATMLLCVMIAAKLTEMFRLRDARVVAALGYFLIATQFLFSQRLAMIAYLVAGCWIVTLALIAIQRDADHPPDTARPAGDGLAPAATFAWKMLLLAAPFALLLFTLFPRLASPLWGMPDRALDGRTGLSGEMSPGTIANLFIDDSPAFRVEFDGPVPAHESLYWRGPVLWRFDGRTWSRMFYQNAPRESLPSMSPEAIRYEVQLEPSERRWLFTLDYPLRWPDDTRLSSSFELVRREPVTRLTAYMATSQPAFIDTPELGALHRSLALRLPDEGNPRTRELAAELRRQHAEDRDLIQAVLDWFTEDEFYYSLETSPLGRNGADEFLFDLKTGYCEYYASAFAILMRAAGIPARIVTGYQGGFWQPDAEYLLVRQSDAHAWVEVWLAGSGWTRVDPTAAVSPTRIREGAYDAVGSRPGWLNADWAVALRNRLDRLQHLWNDWVLGFNAERQNRLLDRLGLGPLPTGMIAVIVVLAAALVLLPMVRLAGAEWRERLGRDPALRAWRRLQRRLERAGLATGPELTPAETAREAASWLANHAELQELTLQYQRLRYGPSEQELRAAFLNRARRWRPVRAADAG